MNNDITAREIERPEGTVIELRQNGVVVGYRQTLDFDSDYALARTRVETRLDALREALDNYSVTTNGLGMTNYRHVAAMNDVADALNDAYVRLFDSVCEEHGVERGPCKYCQRG